jgi:hypothetical protein
MLVTVIAPVEAVPFKPFVPLQAPDAVQELAFVVAQFNVDVPPDTTLAGEAVSVTVGAALAEVTVTVAVAWLVPPGPVQVST